MPESKPGEKPHVSPAQLDLASRCGEAWRRRYVEGEKIPPPIVMIQGTGVHKGAAINSRQKIETRVDLSTKDIVDAAVSAFDDELKGGVAYSQEEVSQGIKIVNGEARDWTAMLAELYAKQVAPVYQPVLVEHPAMIELPNASHNILGILDLADEERRVVDYKTAGKSKSQDDADTSIALTYYAAAHLAITGQPASEVRLETLVKTKTPKRQLLVSQRGADDFAVLAARTNALLHMIQVGSFMPATPGAWWCGPRYCGYWNTCAFVNAERKAKAEE